MAKIEISKRIEYDYAEIKPCPFCGSENMEFIESYDRSYICCKSCLTRSQSINTSRISIVHGRRILVEMWNKRANNEQLD